MCFSLIVFYLHWYLVLFGWPFVKLFRHFSCIYKISKAWSFWEPKLWYLNLTKLFIVPFWNSSITAPAQILKKLLKIFTFNVFIFNLPTLISGPHFSPFLFTLQEIYDLSRILPQFWIWIIKLFPKAMKITEKNQVSTRKFFFCAGKLDGRKFWFLQWTNQNKSR